MNIGIGKVRTKLLATCQKACCSVILDQYLIRNMMQENLSVDNLELVHRLEILFSKYITQFTDKEKEDLTCAIRRLRYATYE